MRAIWQRIEARQVLLVSVGVALFALATNNSVLTISIASISVVALLVYRYKEISIGNRWITPAIGIIILSILLSPSIWAAKAYVLLIVLFYLLGTTVGRESFRVTGWLVLLGALSIIPYSIIGGIHRSGGIFNSFNYNLATGAVVLGFLLWQHKWQWWFSPIPVAGLFFTGAEEALVVTSALGLYVLVKRQFNKAMLLPIGTLALLLAICTPLGITQALWQTTLIRVDAARQIVNGVSNPESLDIVTGKRNEPIVESLRDIKPLGHGYEPLNVKYETIHNTPLRIMYELGPVAMLSWLWIMGYGLWKRKELRLVLIAILAIGMVDHLIWTQLGLWTWAIIGIVSERGNESVSHKGK